MTDQAIEEQNIRNDDVVENVNEEAVETTETIDQPESDVEVEQEAEEPKELELEDLPLPGDEKETKKSDLPKWAEKRLSKKDREIQEARYQAELLKAENEKLKNSQSFNQPNVPVAKMPEREDFDTEAEYISAIVDHKNQQMMNKLIAQKAQIEVQEKEEAFLKNWQSSEESGLKKYHDFDEKFEILNDRTFPPNRMMAEAIVESPFKEDILYFLGSNPDHARKLAQLSGIQATKKIAEIESRFAARKKAAASTKAPALIQPLKANKGAPAKIDPEKIPQEDFDRWYREKYSGR